MYSVNVSNVPPHYIKLSVENKKLDFQLDTGSDVTVITLKDKNNYFGSNNIQKCNVKFRNFDQSISEPVGILKNLEVKYNGKIKTLNAFVSHDSVPRILGRDWLKELDLWPPTLNFRNTNVISQTSERQMYVSNVSEAERAVKEKFAKVFTPGWGDFKGEAIKLKLKPDAKPKCLPVRRTPLALKDKVKLEISRLLENGRITPVEHNQWGTPVVPILKPDGSVRLCGDYKLTLNPHLEVDHFPLPHIEDILNLKGGEYFCELDLKEAYLQAPLDIDSQNLTTIATEVGTYKYKYLPFGVSTGPGALISNKLNNIPNTVVFIDNIYITGNNLNDTYKTLCMVLKRLHECQFKLKLEKCKLFQKHRDVFGFRITKNEISVIKSNVEPLLNTKAPTNITLLRSFLGKVNYYSRFLQNMAEILVPLYDCLKNKKFNWTPDCEKSFNLIKQKLASLDNLIHHDMNLPLILTCDASNTAVAACISNRDINGMVRPIAYASKKINEAEQKYSAIDKEAMAIIFGVTKFYNYTYGRTFELKTDNSALVRIFGPTKGIPKMAAKRLQHYAIFLSAFNYKIRHIKTNKNPADFLSRAEVEEIKQKNVKLHPICLCGNVSNLNYVNNSEIKNLNWKDIQKESGTDNTLSKVLRYIMDGWPEKKGLEKEVSIFYNRKDEITSKRGCLFWGYRIIVPTSLRKSILTELHKSHFGIVCMKQIARSYFWWPNLDSDIENITKNCMTCLNNHKNPPKSQLKPWPVPPSTWYRIHADFLGPFYNKMYLVIVDGFLKWPEAFEMANITANRTIEVLKNVFSRFGFPVHLVTDNAPTFTCAEFQNYCKITGIKHTFSPPYHPATNGAAERFVETFKSHITKIKESGNSLNSAINLFLFDYRNLPHGTTGLTPARLMLGRELRNRFSLLRPPPVHEKSYEMLEKQKQYALGNRTVDFIVGEKVIVRDYRKVCKPWVQAVIVGESVPGVTFIVDVEGGNWKRHVNQMLKCDSALNE